MTSPMMNMPLTITSLMQFAERVNGDTEMVSVTADNPRHRYTFADAFRRVRRLANALRALGMKPGDRIATLAWNDHRHFELYYAISSLGMVCHTINPRLFPEQLVYIVNHADDRVLFIDPMFLPLLEKLRPELPRLQHCVLMTDSAHMPDASSSHAATATESTRQSGESAKTAEPLLCYESLLEAQGETIDWPLLDENTPSALCYTSGTTGNPKGVLYTHRSTMLHAYASVLPDVFGLTRRDVVMPLVPMFHVHAWGAPFAAAITGSKVVMAGPRMADGATLTALIVEEGVTVSSGVPTIWLALLKYLDESGKSIAPLKRIVVGGAACPLSIMEAMDRHGVYTHAAWGMTEMSPLGTFNSLLDRAALGEAEFKRLRLKAGRPVFGVEMKIVDDDNREQPWDGVAFGRLKVRGPWVASGYFKQETSSAHDADGWFDTGDMATIDADGNMQITDRSKDVIKSGGEWISSIDVENVAANHPAVAQAAVIGLPHPKWSERPLLLVIKKPGVEVVRAQMLAWFQGRIASWWVPDDVVFVDSLPHTATGKVSKKDLRQQFEKYQWPAS